MSAPSSATRSAPRFCAGTPSESSQFAQHPAEHASSKPVKVSTGTEAAPRIPTPASSARASRKSASARHRSAVRARFAVIGWASSVSRPASSRRARTRVKDSSIVHRVVPDLDALRAAGGSICSRSRPSRGRSTRPVRGLIPASDRVPEPRMSPRRTVSAWSLRVWAVRIQSAPHASVPISRAA
jgi:hypothetical protein